MVLVLLLTLEIVLIAREHSLQRGSSADIRAAARFSTVVTSFDYRSIDRDVERTLALGTPGLKGAFAKAMGPNFTQRVRAQQLTSVGKLVVGPRLQREGSGRASFLVLLDQRITPITAANQAVRVGLLVTVQERDHKIASVEVV